MITKSVAFLKENLPSVPETFIILGSGLGEFVGKMKNTVKIPYREIPEFVSPTVGSHSGTLVYGTINDKPLVLLSGRAHYYEGYSFLKASHPVRTLALAGAKQMIVTNAAGGVNRGFKVGDIMLITDHIKLTSDSPARGILPSYFGDRFFDMTEAYSLRLRKVALEAAGKLQMVLREGVYFYMAGPQFETPAEIRAIELLGGDAVGMSTVSEVIAARQMELEVLGLSLITNAAAGITGEKLSDDDVVATASRSGAAFGTLIEEILRII